MKEAPPTLTPKQLVDWILGNHQRAGRTGCRAHLERRLQKQFAFSRAESKRIVNQIFAAASASLRETGRADILPIGQLQTVQGAPKQVRNFQTGEHAHTKGRMRVRLIPTSATKRRVQGAGRRA